MKPFGFLCEIELKLAFKLQLRLLIPPPGPQWHGGESKWWTLLRLDTGRVYHWDL